MGQWPALATVPRREALSEHACGTAIGHVFLVVVAFAILALVCVLSIEETPLRTTVGAADPGAIVAVPAGRAS